MPRATPALVPTGGEAGELTADPRRRLARAARLLGPQMRMVLAQRGRGVFGRTVGERLHAGGDAGGAESCTGKCVKIAGPLIRR